MSDIVDVVIVGAGAAGAMLAAYLAEAKHSVLVLEAGPKRDASDLISSQIWSRRLRWGGPPVASTGPEPIGFGFNAGWGTGGAALHHYATWPRMHPADFKMKSAHGRGIDWPIGYDDLRPFYDAVQREIGISGDAVQEVWRPAGAPYPMPPLDPRTARTCSRPPERRLPARQLLRLKESLFPLPRLSPNQRQA